MAGKDYGPKGCCGPSSFAVLLLGFGGLAAAVIHRSQPGKGGGPGDVHLGLVSARSLAGGKGFTSGPTSRPRWGVR